MSTMIPRRTLIRALAVACASTVLATPAFLPAAAEPPSEWDGLQQHASKRVNLLYTRPGASLAGYKRVRLEPLQVTFDKNWDPNRSRLSLSSRLTKDDFETIKKGLAEEFAKVSAQELAKGGYTMADQADEDVLDVTPFVVDLYITAPDKSVGRSRTYVANAGHMTLVAELRDSETGQVLARAIDKVRGKQTGSFQVASSVTNMADARAAIAKWAAALRDGLDDANGRSDSK